MTEVSDYSTLRKTDQEGQVLLFHPVLVAGLAVELGHKLCRDRKGLGKLTPGDLTKLHIAGDTLQLKDDNRWRKLRSCTLKVKRLDAALALETVHKQRKLFSDINFNCWDVDAPMPAGLGNYDVLGEFSTSKNFGAKGTVWVELKLFAATDFDNKFHKAKTWVEKTLAALKRKKAGVDAGMLVAVKVEKVGSTWVTKDVVAQLQLTGCPTQWSKVAGKAPKPITRGRADPSLKPTWQELMDKLEQWEHPDTGETVYLLNNFLKHMPLAKKSLKKRMVGFHKILRSNGIHTKFDQPSFPNRPGSKPWAGTEEMYQCLHSAL